MQYNFKTKFSKIMISTGENFFKFVTFPRAACLQVHVVANRQCLMKFLAPVDPSIEYTTNKCFRLTASRSRYVLTGLS